MRLYFAGAETPYVMEALQECGVNRVLVSYYYVRRKKVKIDELLKLFPSVVMDSGAFSIFKKNISMREHNKYFDEYIDFLKEHAGKFYWAANYDVESFVGNKLVDAWNDKLLAAQELGQTICFIAHDYSVPYTRLHEYFNRYKYIGISTDSKLRKDNTSYLSLASVLSNTHKKLTHGFGMTSYNSITNFPFNTTDSTTYLGSARYGSTYVWNGAFFETWDYMKKYRRKTLHHWCEKWNLDFDRFMRDEHKEVTKFSIMSWLENEKHYNRITRHKQWWLSDEDKRLINQKAWQ